MHGPSRIVDCDALLQVRGETDISLFGKRHAPDEVDVEHIALSETALLRQGFGGQPRSNLAPAVLLAVGQSQANPSL